ncbi:unnamed protein product [Taenia asiatica]|uniref:Uncharacterized protein n=1 Tax=Taenia asiatica TaxID=60517 RepID=A0A0R3WFF6_TAEAS|nr:unnamed protein product [Taenia asiatica]
MRQRVSERLCRVTKLLRCCKEGKLMHHDLTLASAWRRPGVGLASALVAGRSKVSESVGVWRGEISHRDDSVVLP